MMMKKSLLAVALLCFVLPLVAQSKTAVPKKPTKVYMMMDGKISSTKPTSGFYVEGYRSGNGIMPTSGVNGGKDADLCRSSTSPQYWLELSEGNVPNPAGGRPPFTALVRPCLKTSQFGPTSTEQPCCL